MGRNTGKVVLLTIPCMATLGLLIYCLISQQWVEVDEQRLASITETFEREFVAYENRTRWPSSSRVGPLVGKSSSNERTTTPTTTTTTTTTETTTTTTVASTAGTAADPDYTAEDYEDDENQDENGAVQRKRDLSSSSANLFERRTLKGKPGHAMEITSVKKHGDFVYVTQLWPLVKRKSVYSECIEYVRLKLKMSRSYLIAERKAPIVGHIHYYDDGTFDRDAADSIECASRPGTVFCQFTKTCKKGKSCDGVVDCEDQSDEQACGEPSARVCSYANDISGFSCDAKCFQYWHKCDGEPHCFDLSDETSADCRSASPLVNLTQSASYFQRTLASFFPPSSDPMQFTLGQDNFDVERKCFRRYFNFKSPRLIPKETLKYLSQSLADNIQETNNLNYHLHLIYTMAFAAAVVFCLLALFSLVFLTCFGKLCFQCPFWFFGFFQILAWLTSLCGLMTFLYAFWMDKQRSIDPNAANTLMPVRAELVRLNPDLVELERLGLTFWLATGAVGSAFLGSFLACIICCRLPSSRHEDKEYKIMQLPTYS